MMKKIIPVLLCVLLIGALALSASAADSSVTLNPSATNLELGDTFTVVAKLTNTEQIQLGTVALSYDESVFELTGGECHVEGANPALVIVDQKAGTFFLGAPKAVAGDIFTFNFKVKDNAAYGTYKITPTAAIGTSTGNEIQATGTTITVVCEHTYPKDSDGNYIYTQVGADKHQQTCTKCNTPKVEAHTWDDGAPVSPVKCTEDGEEKYTCVICHTTKTEKITAIGHAWDNDCDTTCNNDPSHTRTTSHKYTDKWTSDSTSHWHQCSSCGERKDNANHTPGPAATQEAAQTCTVCNYEIAPKLVHEHQFSTEWVSDSENHWHRCLENNPICIVKDSVTPHDYDNACDIDCNTCGYIRVAPHSTNGEWRANANGHWSVCTICNADTPVLPHIPGPEATADTPQTCAECNFVIKMELSHVHEFGETWYSDDENHWQSCNDERCPEVQSREPHTWDEGEELPEGGFLYTCSICAKQVTLTEPMPTEPVTEPSTGATTQPVPTQKPAEKEPKDAISWEWAGIAAIVLLIIGMVLLVIEFIRSRKTNMKGKFSK